MSGDNENLIEIDDIEEMSFRGSPAIPHVSVVSVQFMVECPIRLIGMPKPRDTDELTEEFWVDVEREFWIRLKRVKQKTFDYADISAKFTRIYAGGSEWTDDGESLYILVTAIIDVVQYDAVTSIGKDGWLSELSAEVTAHLQAAFMEPIALAPVPTGWTVISSEPY